MNSLVLALAGIASAQQLLPTNPGGAVPSGVTAPSVAGFQNATIKPSTGGLAVCASGFVPVSVTAKNDRFKYEVPVNQSQVTQTILDLFTAGSTFSEQIANGTHSVNGTYLIGATLCTPANEISPSQVQILSHGIGFDRSYWDFAPGYSYVDVAASYGYASFFYDRLGVGLSSKPDGLSVVQSFTELEILNSLVTKLRRGHFSNTTFSEVVGVGHSYGSILTQGLTAKYPAAIDAAILTGFSVNSSGMAAFTGGLDLQIASLNSPYRFSGLNNSYLVFNSDISNQWSFFRAPNFDPSILSLATATKGAVTFGEFFSITAVESPATNYTKPVAIVNGANDLPFCNGNCSYPSSIPQAALKQLYPATNRTGTYLAPLTGHGINLHYTAVEAYHYIQGFVKKNL